MQHDPNFFLVVSETAPLGRFEAGADKAAIVLTQQLRRICAGYIATLPAGQMISSHSWREMAAVACWRARYDSISCSP
eukprot:SAG31_NODE_1340_length_8709_cov_8.259117_1_plen_78_part_00